MVVWHLGRAAVIAAAGAAVTLAQLGLPSSHFWDARTHWQWASVAVVAFFSCYDAVRSVNHVMQATRVRDYDNDLRSALSATVTAVVEVTGAPWDELAVHYYRRRGRALWCRLVCVGAIQAGADALGAQRSFRPGVGIAGTAFTTQKIITEQWRDFVQTATRHGPEEWARRAHADRFGLTWGQLRRQAQPEAVLASPTFAASGRPDGCILITGPIKPADLDGDLLRRVVDELATVLDRLGPPPTGWWSAHGR